jgi:prepilin-type N-terminal cleavage/methylation domain-containing protein
MGNKKSAGFTLIELLIAMSIIGLIFTFVMLDYRSIEKDFALQRSAHKLIQDIRSAQNMAAVTKETGGVIPERYGVYLDTDNPTEYILFADVNGDGIYDPNEDIDLNAGEDPLEFETRISIAGITPSSPLHITFYSPEPTTVLIYGSGLFEADEVSISLNYQEGEGKKININKAGLIEVE